MELRPLCDGLRDDRTFGAVGDRIDDSRGALLSFRTMPRTARVAPGGHIYHVLNRSVGKSRLFGNDAEFEAFEQIMVEAHRDIPFRSWRILSCRPTGSSSSGPRKTDN